MIEQENFELFLITSISLCLIALWSVVAVIANYYDAAGWLWVCKFFLTVHLSCLVSFFVFLFLFRRYA